MAQNILLSDPARPRSRKKAEPEPVLTIQEAITKSARYLAEKGADAPRLDAELLLAHVLGCDRLKLYLEWNKPLVELEIAAYRDLIRQRGQNRIPTARLLGKKEFYRREFVLSPDAFVPRPETEGVVERALDLIATEPVMNQGQQPTIFEVGTGSGCITVTLAAENGAPHYIASDISPTALGVARANAQRLGVAGRIDFREGDLLAGYEGTIHLLVSNPPYIPTGQIPTLPPEVRDHDPMAALDGGEDGLDIARRILRAAKTYLAPGGCVLMELGEDQEEGILEAFRLSGVFESTTMEKDHAGRPRYAFGRKKA